MGDPSYLRFVPADCAKTPIDWDKIPEASKKHLERWATDKGTRRFPRTIGELAKWFDDSKFFGYMDPALCTLLLDISEFGLAKAEGSTSTRVGVSTRSASHSAQQPEPLPPRFYMTYLDQVWFALFTPGERGGVCGFSSDLHVEDEDEDDSVDEDAQEADERALAETFDAKLQPEIRLGMVPMVPFSKQLAGWQAVTFLKTLDEARVAEQILALPSNNPLLSIYMANFNRMLQGRG